MTDQKIEINGGADVPVAVAYARRFAQEAGGDAWVCAQIATATSELANNIVKHAHRGKICLQLEERELGPCVVVWSIDKGPGIEDVDLAMSEAYSSVGTLGLGLPSVSRIMDEFEVVSSAPFDCRIVARKYIKAERAK